MQHQACFTTLMSLFKQVYQPVSKLPVRYTGDVAEQAEEPPVRADHPDPRGT